MRPDDERKMLESASTLTKSTVVSLLRQDVFGRAFRGVLRNTGDYEQGFMTGFGSRNHKFYIHEPQTVEEGSLEFTKTTGKMRKNLEVPVIFVHTHNLGYGDPMAWMPSTPDLMSLSGYWIMDKDTELDFDSVGSLILLGRKPEAWVWQNPKEEIVERVKLASRNWDKSLVGNPTHGDIDTFEQELKRAGLNLIRQKLDRNNMLDDFINLIAFSSFKFGIR